MRSAHSSILFIGFFSLLPACPTGTGPIDTADRAETRASISGRVVLADVAGLNDMSRVRVEIGPYMQRDAFPNKSDSYSWSSSLISAPAPYTVDFKRGRMEGRPPPR